MIKTCNTVLRKIYLSLYLKGLCVRERVGDRTELQHIDPHSIGHNRVSFPFSWAAQPGAWGPSLSETCCYTSIFSPTGLVSKLTEFLSSPSYIIVQRPPTSCVRHNFALIQPVQSQGYNILIIPRPDTPVIYTGAFPILISRPGRRSIYNSGSLIIMRRSFTSFRGEANLPTSKILMA